MNRIKVVLLLICTFLVVTACKEEDPKPSIDELQLQKLIGTWKMSNVTVDGTNVNNQYKDFVLTVFKDAAGTKWVATNGAYAFPSVGMDSWSFVQGSEATKIIRSSDNVQINIQVTETILTLEFTIVAPPIGGRVNGLEGHFVFGLIKN